MLAEPVLEGQRPAHVSAKTPLDWRVKHETSYCIPIWLRDEQVKLAIARKDVGRIESVEEKRIEPIAIVGFGPSLQDTWEQVREFKYVITCSGAHKFLLSKGIIPTWHCEVDPRPHKVELLGTPHPEVTYLPASTCHPDYFDHLVKHGAKVKLWHVFANEEDAFRTLPRGEWALTGGPDVGLRSMLIARFFGFRNLHVFGMDGCLRENPPPCGGSTEGESQRDALRAGLRVLRRCIPCIPESPRGASAPQAPDLNNYAL